MKLSESEWALMEVLWAGERFALHEIEKALRPTLGWSKNTVHTYLTRMAGKGMVDIEKGQPRPYSAAVSRERCARDERAELLGKVYGGAAGDLIAAFLKETHISGEERDRLRRLLDEMEV
ncbi:MAG: BlaI/MecI/CopY family transcriptional regulator [Clostridia bacterium]|nr:BlaI/MecI/CopY family transcriptional regulator [Clostridia bacterium]MBQ9926180.1 BlaI/MecI/CopY family transcriptional regulator [Clostridia bacterium]